MNSSNNTLTAALPHVSGYCLNEQLYHGSRTAVYRGVQVANQQPIVMKMLLKEYPSFSELVQFRNQYTIAKNLRIPGVVQPLSLEALGSGYAIVMEDCGGMALNQYLQQQKVLSCVDVLDIALQLATILADLAQHRVVHKDIKPANILIQPDSKQVKLIDFSIASLLPKEIQDSQSPNSLEGTLAYLAPEQTGRMNRGIDYRTDFYALGVTLYQLLTGTLPFNSEDPLELVHCHIAKQPVPVHQVNPDVPAAVSAIAAKLMAKNAEDRYQSAMGLKHDLEHCLRQWQETSGVMPFQLGQRDLSDRFMVPEKLYGREQEVQTLLEAFDRVAKGGSELMLVAGFSGIGKTAVVNEVLKPIVRQRGYFIRGKYDQFNRNVPLSAFVQALRDLMRQLLTESDQQVAQFKAQILAVTGDNGQVLIDVIPELEQIIGKQPAAPELSGGAAQNRFNLLFQRFIQVLTTAEHPLVIFLDDLQWADVASLQLIRLLIDNSYLLILGAYRDNEVSPTHPFILTVEDIKKSGATIQTITLAPLAIQETNRLIADALNCPIELAHPLTELVDRKTQGNPFFTTQFLKVLYEEGCIHLNQQQRCWECDISKVNTLSLNDDVVEFMALRLQKLPLPIQAVLKLAACLGNQFDLNTLAIIAERPPTETAQVLWKALEEGLILPANQVYKFFQGTEHLAAANPVNPSYRFLHDRVQQAAYSLIPTAQKEATHYNIGQLLLNQLAESEQSDRLFDIVNHINIGQSLLNDDQAKEEMAQLNLAAAQKATTSTAYEAAIDYLETGITLLGETAWQQHYDLTFNLYHHLCTAQLISSNYEQLSVTAEIVLQNVANPVDRANIYGLLVTQYTLQGKCEQAIETGVIALSNLGVEITTENRVELIHQDFTIVNQALESRPINSLLELPIMINPVAAATVKLLISLQAPAYLTAQIELHRLVGIKSVRLSIEHGNIAESIAAYTNYGFHLGVGQGKYQRSYEFADLAMQLSYQINSKSQQCQSAFLLASWIHVWAKPIAGAEIINYEGFLAGMESGEIQFAAYNLFGNIFSRIFQGENLATVAESIESYQLVADQNQDLILHSSLAATRFFVRTLTVTQADDDHLRLEADTILHKGGIAQSICLYYLLRMHLACLNDDFEQGLYYFNEATKLLNAVTGFVTYSCYYYHGALIHLNLYSMLSQSEQCRALEQVQACQERLKAWSDSCPQNFLHQYCLVEAEYQRVLGNKAAAIAGYDRAIAAAKENGFIQEESLANELAAKFYLNWGKAKIAQDYLINAYYGYTHWGATTKLEALQQCYPTLLAALVQRQNTNFNVETVIVSESFTVSQSSNSSTRTSLGGSNTLDLTTVIKASQMLSSEIQLDQLLAKLLKMLLENAGADKGVLLMPRQQEWFVEAISVTDQPVQIAATNLNDSCDLPHSLVQVVKSTLQPSIVDDSLIDPSLINDSYVVKHQPKSLLCSPILNQGKLLAILYLENKVINGAFTSDRVELLNILCTQAAISLENARLYQQAQAYAQQLEQSQLQTVQSEKMASLGNLVAGVAHEINNPLGFLNGSINNSKEYTTDLLGHLALYQQYYPEPVAQIQDNAEDIDLEFLSEDLPKLLDSMKGATNRIKGISTSLRTFSRADTEHKVSANLHEGLDSTLLILKYRLKANEARPEIKIIQNYGDFNKIECFPGQLNQVFMNLLANAIDMFDEMAQTQSIEALTANPQRITIQTEQIDRQMVIRICDNGKGMDDVTQARIFDHLFTTKEVGKGTGLGLAIARQIVEEKHGGRLEVQSELGQGTTFCIRLPIDS